MRANYFTEKMPAHYVSGLTLPPPKKGIETMKKSFVWPYIVEACDLISIRFFSFALNTGQRTLVELAHIT